MPVLFPTTGAALFEIKKRTRAGVANDDRLTAQAYTVAQLGVKKAQALSRPLRPPDIDYGVWAPLNLAMVLAEEKQLGIRIDALDDSDAETEIDGDSLHGAAYLGYLLIGLRENLGGEGAPDPYFVVSASAPPHDSTLSKVKHLRTKYQAAANLAARKGVAVTFLYCGEPDWDAAPGVTAIPVTSLADLANVLVEGLLQKDKPRPAPTVAPPRRPSWPWLLLGALVFGSGVFATHLLMTRQRAVVDAAPSAVAFRETPTAKSAPTPSAPPVASATSTTSAPGPVLRRVTPTTRPTGTTTKPSADGTTKPAPAPAPPPTTAPTATPALPTAVASRPSPPPPPPRQEAAPTDALSKRNSGMTPKK